MQSLTHTERIARLNDELRIYGRGGTILITSGVRAKGNAFVRRALAAMRSKRVFRTSEDPHGERDFGVVEVDGVVCFWKIDYYALDSDVHSPDPSNPFLTRRVLTLMLAEEY